MANTENILLKISDAPGLLPSGFTEQIYIKGRTKRIGTYDEKLVTDEKFTMLIDDKTEQQTVQTISYDKYQLVLLKKENHNIELIQQANTIIIYDYTDNSEHHARILTYTSEEIAGSTNQKVTIEYYDNYSENYYNGSNVINLLRSDVLLTRFPFGSPLDPNINKVSIAGTVTYTFYSAFKSEQKIEVPILEETELNGQNITQRIVQKYKRRLILYCNEEDAAELHFRSQYANGYNTVLTINEGTTYTAQERPEITVTKEPLGIDLWKVELIISTNIIDFNPYST